LHVKFVEVRYDAKGTGKLDVTNYFGFLSKDLPSLAISTLVVERSQQIVNCTVLDCSPHNGDEYQARELWRRWSWTGSNIFDGDGGFIGPYHQQPRLRRRGRHLFGILPRILPGLTAADLYPLLSGIFRPLFEENRDSAVVFPDGASAVYR